MYCVNCGKEIPEGVSFCPECGSQQVSRDEGYTPPVSQETVKKTRYNTLCVIGFIVSMVSLLLNFWGIVGIAGLVLSVLGLKSCEEKNENGRSFAIGGIVAGCFSILYAVLVLVGLW